MVIKLKSSQSAMYDPFNDATLDANLWTITNVNTNYSSSNSYTMDNTNKNIAISYSSSGVNGNNVYKFQMNKPMPEGMINITLNGTVGQYWSGLGMGVNQGVNNVASTGFGGLNSTGAVGTCSLTVQWNLKKGLGVWSQVVGKKNQNSSTLEPSISTGTFVPDGTVMSFYCSSSTGTNGSTSNSGTYYITLVSRKSGI